MQRVHEVNFDGLVGPTHNYSGLSSGNLASTAHAKEVANPKEAALQGLKKMALLRSLGIKQAVLPPQERPSIAHLKALGFRGSDAEVLEKAYKQAPLLLNLCSSASCMWTANAATVAPSSDTEDAKVHFTAANLVAKAHRSLEREATSRVLKAIFKSEKHFAHHAPLLASDGYGDEGAANHNRLAPSHGEAGLHLFVYGRSASNKKAPAPKIFPARQTLEASESIARLHRLDPKQVILAQQNPKAIDAGVFHNDVISVSNQNCYFFHEDCFLDKKALKEIQTKWEALTEVPLHLVRVPRKQIALKDVVKSYLFNSQLITLPSGEMALIAPKECSEIKSVRTYLKKLVASGGPIKHVHTPELRQSMQNGGGPACLRLRVVLNDDEIKAANPGVFIDDKKQKQLETWVGKHYRDRLSAEDLRDPKLLTESRTALDELTQILGLGTIYPFQGAV